VLLLVFAAFQSMLYFALWWFSPEHVKHWSFFLPLTISTFWLFYESFMYWFYLLGMRAPSHRDPGPGITVDVFTTAAPGEPLSMFEESLPALKAIRYPHRTYLLDGSGNEAIRSFARDTGIDCIDCIGVEGAKAGKINHALRQTTGDIVLVIDPDHIAAPNFLDRVLGCFSDSRVGFVQVVQAYHNRNASFVARASAEQTYGFYGPILMGMHGYGTPMVIGANCTFRREALESIGDMRCISLRISLHRFDFMRRDGNPCMFPKSWPGGLSGRPARIFPPAAEMVRGMFQALFAVLPRLLFKLHGWQKLSYF